MRSTITALVLCGVLVTSVADLVAQDTAAPAQPVTRVRLDVEGAPAIGPRSAPVTVAMFVDYQCRFCFRSHETLARVLSKYGDRVRIAYLQNPSRFHRDASLAAQAALTAYEMGRFRPYHELLSADPQRLRRDDLVEYARRVGLDVDDFETALDDRIFADVVGDHAALAKRIGASGTPFFFVNGRPLRGAQPLETFERIIDEELAGSAGPSRWVTRLEGHGTHDHEHEHDHGAGAIDPASLPTDGTEVERAILRELMALNAEIRRLRHDVTHLRRAVNDIRKVFGGAAGDAPPQAAPVPERLSLDDDPVLGSRKARVGIVEFSEFECGFCARFHRETFPQIKSRYVASGKVLYVFRDFPLGFHKQARDAAIAANCAGEQGAYWAMHHELFENQKKLGAALYEELAARLGLDRDTFERCMQEAARSVEIDRDVEAAREAGVDGTPTFFIGRVEGNDLVDLRRLVGAQSIDAIAVEIDRLLAATDGPR